ncbi:DNA-binding LacI/PurR family transcriptional regulator [Microbacteriaceae bacterium SG_E_30_P1]|uniref:DNA-binding LacI/PurR family transcriptional regulator n=1 Tax=Antiquaquibacter oligotrophicus TaxID=2880260 RepID=A0ABT6KQM0_9MICO|nr:LacI family DNA-binding transcriptional regulator [Antiquaquibacter oligotrophicus]MDH6182278.1 DNA-binding LacI/PurR family transcriptional regulator [Antiquaquibacter oligotrophicus]UDF12065.1 LacI family DNA-binding transcriptional regulator [Antiquaquibacter oligotrophicus]
MTTEASRPTLASVAALAGVSASTASLAFSGAGPVSGATRDRVLAAARELGYAGPDPRAQSLRRGRSGIIGVVMEDRLSDAFRDPVNIAMLDGVSEELGIAGYSLLLLTDTGDNHATLAAAPVDGVIMVGCSRELDDPVTAFRQRGIPIVAIEADRMDGVLHIDLDNRDASARAARYLHELGHRRVALVTLPLEGTHTIGPLTAEAEAASRVHTTLERIRGVRDVFSEATGVVAGGSSVEDGLVAGRMLLAGDERPSAVIAQSDLLALGVIRAAEEAGLAVPGDLSVIGFDGVRIEGAGDYELTTMAQPSVDKGRAAGRAAVDLLGDGEAAPASFTSELRVGNTTAPPR